MSDPRVLELHAAASSSLKQFFALLQEHTTKFPDHSEQLVTRAKMIIAFRIAEEEEEHEIDLKQGPMPLFHTRDKFSPDTHFDLIVQIDTKERFLNLLTQKEDGMKAYSSGSVKLVKGSMRTLLKLRSLQDLAERWKQDLFTSSPAAPAPAAAAGDDKLMQGYLDKQSDWFKRWNSRYVVLQWNDTKKPKLKIYSSQQESRASGSAARQEFELHSAVQLIPAAAWQFSLVDPRQGNLVLCTMQCASKRSFDEWRDAFATALQARKQAVELARRRLMPEDGGEVTSTGNLLDLLLATQRLCTKHAEELLLHKEQEKRTKEDLLALQGKTQDADDFLVYSTLESDMATLLRWYGWKLVPTGLFLAFTTKIAVFASLRVAFALCSFPAQFLPGLSRDTWTKLSMVALVCATWHYLTLHRSTELLRRRVRVYAFALQAIWRFKLSSLKAEMLPPIHSQAMWNVEFRVNAEKLYLLALELRGLWVKSAQFLGARPDIIPDQALLVLKRLHDDVPATPFSLVKPAVEFELGCKLSDMFNDFDEDPLASASIGQVHTAHLSSSAGNAKVVVKVQHPHIENKIQQDLTNMQQIVRLVEWIEPDFQGRDLVDEWSREVGKELDFDQEARNMLEVGANLAKQQDKVYACLPLPISFTKRTLVMRYVQGAKVNDLDVLRRVSGVETDAERIHLAEDICHAYACQIFLNGLFQADAHPGNILVARRSELDPTAVQFLPPAPQSDAERAIPILLDFGLTKRLPVRIRLAFCRMVCAMQQMDISQLLLSFEEMGLRLKREDPFEDLEEFRFAFRETSSAGQSREEMLKHVQKAKTKMESRTREERNPVEAFPTELMLFFRTIFLLRGLCTSLQVQVKYLSVMCAWAKRALMEKDVQQLEVQVEKYNSLEQNIVDTVMKLRFVGLQVCVLHRGEEVAGLALGRKHEWESPTVEHDTLFPCLGLGQGVVQIALRSVLVTEQRVCEVWPKFAHKEVLVEDMLVGNNLPFPVSAVPARFSVAAMHRWKEQVQFVEDNSEQVLPTALPWELSTLSYSWGWSMVGLMQAAVGDENACAYERFVDQELGSKLGGNLLARAPESELPAAASKKGSLSEQEDAAREQHRNAVNSQYATLCVDLERMSNGAFDLDKMLTSTDTPAVDGFDLNSVVSTLHTSLKGKEYLIDPRIMNCPQARSSLSPSCNLLANATALARLFYAIGCNNGKWDKEQVVPQRVADFYASSHQTASEPLSETLGIKTFEFKQTGTGEVICGFGQITFGGSLVITVPNLSLTMCVLVNDLTLEREVPRSIVSEVCREFGLELKSEI